MPISFDTTGLQPIDSNSWRDPGTGDIVTMNYFDLVPDLPAPLDDVDVLRRGLAERSAESGCLIEAFVIWVDHEPALLRMEKFPLPNQQHGLAFVASIIVPKDRCSAVFQILCPETGTTGVREAVLMTQIGYENMFPPHPYAPGLSGRLPYHAADEIRWDDQFPDHPLTRARRWVTRTVPTARLAPGFAALPPFAGPLRT
ncbi:hypothetical protein F3087_41025 [Nocardia colli]|uniref:Uncharacterized protein n=1 Tax=Nocardia colli TaxID=2545717 RepID=A0A5N0DTT2_9NOCA|nr:hypothetical protein [Nocardia colli]KAA8880497.1 hypothetical protein F3087_41025 [Nocardia colli]